MLMILKCLSCSIRARSNWRLAFIRGRIQTMSKVLFHKV